MSVSGDGSFKLQHLFYKKNICEVPCFTERNLDPLLRAPQRRAERRVLEHGLQVGAVDELAEDPDLLAEVVVGDAQDADLHKKKSFANFDGAGFFVKKKVNYQVVPPRAPEVGQEFFYLLHVKLDAFWRVKINLVFLK